ncbi:MAG: YggT family protein [Thermodesulfobacteriota bacterium]|nr:YggT family protein [Thermodesulfobacteriota bacterium]
MQDTLYMLGQVIHVLLNIYIWIVVAGALVSWVNPSPYNPIVLFLRRATEPVFQWFRKNLPVRAGGVDFSPMLVVAALILADILVAGSLMESGNVLANLFIAVGQVVHIFLNLYLWIVIISALISWVNPDPYNPIVRFFFSATEPVFAYLRRRIPLNMGGIDFSPVIVIAALVIIDRLLLGVIIQIGLNMKIGRGIF